ncbi:hypothetical protein CHS0354_039843 [Potamilus streckersoni]|uniref:Uncharacterized protein n=1 Tax=Potamilus streckersoni TaxID=2493646 RepID=A0AAE0W1I2_9BIVA|nr:hypothetical protein CHS0354_039843 [Potamilus streckersoni]
MAKLTVLFALVLLSIFGLTYATYKIPYGYSGKSKGVIGVSGGKGFGGYGLAGYSGKGFGGYGFGGKGLGGYGGYGGFGGGGITQIFIPLIFLIIILPLITNLFNNK